MRITVRFEAQVRRAAGVQATAVDVPAESSVRQLVQQLAESSVEPLRRVLLDDAGAVRPTVMVFVNDEHVPLGSERRVHESSVVTITSPISGG